MNKEPQRTSLLSRIWILIPMSVKLYGGFALILAVLIVAIVAYLGRSSEVSVATEKQLTLSPTQIQAIERIGQWEFLSVHDEELVDTVRKGFFSDDHLARIYYGTLRLGIDLSKTEKGWLQAKDDSIVATLPPVVLLDNNFIDEALTRTFFEEGKWDATAYNRLYERAAIEMKKRALNRSNVETAQNNALRQFETLLHSMGFKHVSVSFQKH